MPKVILNFRIDSKTRKKAAAVLKKEGKSEAQFLREAMEFVAETGKIPFKREFVWIPLIGSTGDDIHTLERNKTRFDIEKFFEQNGITQNKIIVASDDDLASKSVNRGDLLGIDTSVAEFSEDGLYITDPIAEYKDQCTSGSAIAFISRETETTVRYTYTDKKTHSVPLKTLRIVGKVVIIKTPKL